jgi:hypothetical protein
MKHHVWLCQVYADAGSAPVATIVACTLGLSLLSGLALGSEGPTRAQTRAANSKSEAPHQRVSVLHARAVYQLRHGQVAQH